MQIWVLWASLGSTTPGVGNWENRKGKSVQGMLKTSLPHGKLGFNPVDSFWRCCGVHFRPNWGARKLELYSFYSTCYQWKAALRCIYFLALVVCFVCRIKYASADEKGKSLVLLVRDLWFTQKQVVPRGKGQNSNSHCNSPLKTIWVITGHVEQKPLWPIENLKLLCLFILCFFNQPTHFLWASSMYLVLGFVQWEKQMKGKTWSLTSSSSPCIWKSNISETDTMLQSWLWGVQTASFQIKETAMISVASHGARAFL